MLTTLVAAVYVCLSLSLPHVNERETDLTLVLADRFNEEEDGGSLSNSFSQVYAQRARHATTCAGDLVRRPSDVLASRPHGDTR